jgi:PPOX class probable F420-dependent enzyme
MELPEAARTMLRGKALGHVVTRNAGGSPQVTLVWVDEDSGDLMFNTSMSRMKAVNLVRDPRVVVSVQNPEAPAQYLVVRGRAELATEGAWEHIDHLSRKFSGNDYPRRDPAEERVMIRVKASRISGNGPWMRA